MTTAPDPAVGTKPPNILLLITDQQRGPRFWARGGLDSDELMPAEAELARTGVSFTNACSASCMCSPSRASLLTGRWPSEHGVGLTLTQGGAEIQPRNAPSSIRLAIKSVKRGEISLIEALRILLRGALRKPDGGQGERELDPGTPNLASILARAGYRTFLRGKWHLTHPVDGQEWSEADSERLARDYGLEGWIPPDAGENIEPSHFGGGNLAGRSEEGFDEDFCRQVEEFLADPPPEPWVLVASLVNPHDVLAYPTSFGDGGYTPADWSDLSAVGLPATWDENLAGKPFAHIVQRFGQASILGGIESEEQAVEYCRFYAHLHRVVDGKVGRIVSALGDPGDPDSLRSRTLVVKTSDHGEMAMSHGGLRQKTFNAYEETINVPMIFSNPSLFPEASESDLPVSLCDVLPTLAEVAGVDLDGDGVRGRSLVGELSGLAGRNSLDRGGVRLDAFSDRPGAGEEEIPAHFTYDDHQSGTAYVDIVPQPNRIRAVRSREAMYAIYQDPGDPGNTEYELYDLESDPDQARNLVDVKTGAVLSPSHEPLRERMALALEVAMDRCRTRIHAVEGSHQGDG